MSRSQRRTRSRAPKAQPGFTKDLRAILKALARAAALSSAGLTGCGSHHTSGDMSQSVPAGEEDGSTRKPAPAHEVDDGGGTAGTIGTYGGPSAPRAGAEPPVPRAGTDTPPPPEPEWVSLGCGEDDRPPLLDDLSLAREVDFAAVYDTFPDYTDGSGGGGEPNPVRVEKVSATGTACATAADEGACQAALDALLVPAVECATHGNLHWNCDPFLVVTAGDEVTRVEEHAALTALLGSIDTGSEAALLAYLEAGQVIACADHFSQPVRGTETRAAEDGYEVRTEWENCGEGVFSRTVHVTRDGEVTELENEKIGVSNCAVGRRPEGLRLMPHAATRTALGAYFARAAALEAASVVAFERLARELAALDAPRELVAWAARSALEEVRHARVVTALAHRFGAMPAAPQVAALEPRAPLAIALENATEGCVRETYGALVAHYQAETARDPAVRAAMAAIADDETRHAQFSWQLAAWLEPRLPAGERETVERARRAAFVTLRGELSASDLSTADAARIGLPDPRLASSLLDRLGAELRLHA